MVNEINNLVTSQIKSPEPDIRKLQSDWITRLFIVALNVSLHLSIAAFNGISSHGKCGGSRALG